VLAKVGKILGPLLYPIIKIAEFLSPKNLNINSYELSKEEIKSLLLEGNYIGEIDKQMGIMLERTLYFGALSVKK